MNTKPNTCARCGALKADHMAYPGRPLQCPTMPGGDWTPMPAPPPYAVREQLREQTRAVGRGTDIDVVLGMQFRIRFDHPWTGPCPACGRARALKRKYRGQLPCTNHERARGVERSWYRATLTKIEGNLFTYETTERISIENPLPGTEGAHVRGGGITADGIRLGMKAGWIIVERFAAESVH